MKCSVEAWNLKLAEKNWNMHSHCNIIAHEYAEKIVYKNNDRDT